ncbi:MAG: hypothetical protein WCI19_13730, partial [Betaproteobacteria bacterium]
FLSLNGRFGEVIMSAKGTQESPEQVEAERQQSEWTGHWRCLYHQAATSLKRTDKFLGWVSLVGRQPK